MVTVVRSPRIRRVPRLGPSSGRPPGAATRTVSWPRAARGRRGGGGAGAPGGALLLRALSGSAPPSRAGTARSDVSAAPPAPPGFTRTSAEQRGGGRRLGAPCPETRPCLPLPSLRSSNPLRKRPALPGSPRATNHLGSGDKPRAGNLAGSSKLQDPGCSAKNGELRGLEALWAHRGLLILLHTLVMVEGAHEGLAGLGGPSVGSEATP